MFDERRRHDSNGGNVSPDAATPALECRDARSRAHELYCAEDFQLIESIGIESGGAPTGGDFAPGLPDADARHGGCGDKLLNLRDSRAVLRRHAWA